MNKEEYAIDEKTYENYDGLKIKIIFSLRSGTGSWGSHRSSSMIGGSVVGEYLILKILL